MSTLPAPSADALAASQALSRHIADQIAAHDGWLPFSRYMELALYTPGLGYYTGGSRKFGGAGDFVTAPELTPLFARTVARQLAELLPHTAGTVYEFGAGTGVLAADLLTALDALGVPPQRYCIVDLSPDLIERQRQTLAERVPHWLDRVEWLVELPAELDGVIIGNEVLDAMPCELLHWNGTPLQRGVTVRDGAFAWEDRPITDAALQSLADAVLPPLPGYTSEISLANKGFIAMLAERLVRGAILLLDYGFPRAEYYHPQRHMGTLIGHYRHHTVDDPFYLPGLMDLTYHVDFTLVAEAGIDAGLDLIGYTSQAQFLINAGLATELAALDIDDHAAYLPTANAVQKLTNPAEMGELFKAIGFGRNVPIDWVGFTQGDRCHTL